MPTLHLSCAAEGEYVAHSATMLHSVLAHAGDLRVHVHYLHSPRLDRAEGERLAGMVDRLGGRLTFHAVDDDDVADLPSMPEFTSAMWHRIFLPDLLPDVDRVLYLDVDTLVVDDLRPLWETELEGRHLAAVTNVFMDSHRFRPAELGLSGPEAYFNSGVLLMNLEQMRRDGATAALRAVARERGDRFHWPDQDALNLVLGERRVPLHPRWNCMNSIYAFPVSRKVFGWRARRKAITAPGIRHFEGPGPNKPWHEGCTQPLRERWLTHQRATPWADGAVSSTTRRRR